MDDEMSDVEFVEQCMALDEAIYELMDGKAAMVCIAVLTKLVGEVLFDMQLDPTDYEESRELLEKARLSVLESYTVSRDDAEGLSDHLH
jgi:hypothetical protein